MIEIANETYYTKKDLQYVLSLSAMTIYNYMKQGKLKGFKHGNKWLFKKSEIDSYLKIQGAK